ncbi:nonsense-mediated mRNA decay factor SMG5 isoform X2 [Aethina tumida]|uniref:nonsense-mediated mRNA decay factor SMG5 isoform X2 n=1 Tax=Aethina tumida TaxID=116153 RepID=UPI0021482BB8|nr:nonsense-mediated mRNA decay factor SMG5 isoform X2 [Aethina tumida]
MKKVYNSADIHQSQGQELSKKLYRTISEQAKRLDDARSCARNIGELFSPNLLLQRRKFCDYCERLIFSDPTLYGKKGEELLWRKGFYDVVSNAKRLRKNEYTPEEISNLQTHINGGIGYYHHLLSKLQTEFILNLGNVIDFPLQIKKSSDSSDIRPEILEWAQLAVHQCLIYLGDLSRYKLEIYPDWEPTLAIRYYLQAISYKPDYGMPHNQMGTLAMNRNQFLDAVYHYIRCLACKVSFEGTSNNLHSLFDKNSKFIEQLPDENQNTDDCIIEPGKTENIKRFIARFLLLIDIWYFNKKVSKVYNLCHQTYKNLEECLSYIKPTNSESGETPTDVDSDETDSSSSPSYLSNDILFKIVVICLLCISKLKSDNPPHLSTLIAFTLGIYSQIIQNVTNHIQESVLNYPLSEEIISDQKTGIIKDLILGPRKSKTKLRRRKPAKDDSEDESEHSENMEDDYSSSDDSFISDAEDVLAPSSDEEGEELDESKGETPEDCVTPTENTAKDDKSEQITKKVQRMDVNDMLEIIGEETNLQSIKVLNDWLRYQPDVMKSCAANTKRLFRQITLLLNLININLANPKIAGMGMKVSEIMSRESKIPLPEDVVLKGIDVLKEAHTHLDWNFIHNRSFTAKDETVIRIVKLISFGKYLMSLEECCVSFDEDNNVFECNFGEEEQAVKLPSAITDELELGEQLLGGKPQLGDGDANGTTLEPKGGGQLNKMKHMGQLWLAAEVRALESRVRGKTSLSPYLVLDVDALIKFTFMVKNLVHSRKFIVIVPTAVVSALDDLKVEKIEARDAIRWLESQFQRGNRFFRAQRPHEKAAIPFIKYPKKKDKEMHIYIQIIECCNYLAEQQKDATNLVTLLIGNHNVLSNGENKEFSYVGLAQSVGIAIESITQFYGKWKKTKGKR